MKTEKIYRLILGSAACLAAAWWLVACEIDSADTVHRDVDIYVAAVYRHPDAGSHLVQNNSGQPIDQLDLRQDGDDLEAIDNNGSIYRGTIGQVDNGTASFTLEGANSIGNKATISGTISVSGSSATMRGTWIEATLYSTVYGVATVPSNKVCNLVLAVSDNTVTNGQVVILTVANGTSPFSWSSSGPGNLGADSTSGNSNVFEYTGTNQAATITVTDSRNCSGSVTLQGQ